MKQRDIITALEKIAHNLETTEAIGNGHASESKGDARAFFMVGWLGASTKNVALDLRALVAKMKAKR